MVWSVSIGRKIPRGLETVSAILKQAERGAAWAQNAFGCACFYDKTEDGEEIKEDPLAGATWLHRAAEQNDRYAQRNLAELYSSGWKIERQPETALDLYRKAAAQEEPRAQAALGEIYSLGEIVSRNEEEAFKWLIKAAVQGDEEAQLLLGSFLTRKGDYVEAYKWFVSAATLRMERFPDYGDYKDPCDLLTPEMTKEEIAEGYRRASFFVPEVKPCPEYDFDGYPFENSWDFGPEGFQGYLRKKQLEEARKAATGGGASSQEVKREEIGRDVTHLIERLEAFEERVGVRLEALFAHNDGFGYLTVNGEMHPRDGSIIKEDIALHVDGYDSLGRLVAKDSTSIRANEFFGFATFSSIQVLKTPELSKIRVYPKAL